MISEEVKKAVLELEKKAESDGIDKKIAGAIVVVNKKILILKRSEKEDFLPGIHEIPSGAVEEGETLLEGLQREVFEETGLVIQAIPAFLNTFDYTSASGKKTRQFNFFVIPLLERVRLNMREHSDFDWWKMNDSVAFEKYMFSKETRQAISEAAKYISRRFINTHSLHG